MKNIKGFSLVEMVVGVGLIGMLALGATYVFTIASQQQEGDRVGTMLSQKRADFQNAVNSDAAWAQTVKYNAPAAQMGCLVDSSGCSLQAGNYFDFALYDAAGNLIYQPGPQNGLNLNGAPCTGASCPFFLSLQWGPSCLSSDPQCLHPFIRVNGKYTINKYTGVMNTAKANFSLVRQALLTSPCAGAAPACGAGLAACLSTGWTCIPQLTPYCSGAVTWNDSSTLAGPCQGNIPAPGVLHDTNSPAVTNTNLAFVGSAVFHCVPGQPNGGFQPVSATCVTPPPVCDPAAAAAVGTLSGWDDDPAFNVADGNYLAQCMAAGARPVKDCHVKACVSGPPGCLQRSGEAWCDDTCTCTLPPTTVPTSCLYVDQGGGYLDPSIDIYVCSENANPTYCSPSEEGQVSVFSYNGGGKDVAGDGPDCAYSNFKCVCGGTPATTVTTTTLLKKKTMPCYCYRHSPTGLEKCESEGDCSGPSAACQWYCGGVVQPWRPEGY